MGRKGGNKNRPSSMPGPHVSITLREESSGKKQLNIGAKTMSKLDHLKSLAQWASCEARVPAVGAFFGQRLAASSEALGIRSDPSLFVCQRCESILQPGNNCTVRIETNKSKTRRRRKKSGVSQQNNVVYKCYACSHRNLMRGTQKGYMKDLYPPKTKPPSKLQPAQSIATKNPTSLPDSAISIMESNKVDTIALLPGEDPGTGPATPLPRLSLTLLESKRRKRKKSGTKNLAGTESTADAENSANASSKMSSKRRRKENAARTEREATPNLMDLTIPFFL